MAEPTASRPHIDSTPVSPMPPPQLVEAAARAIPQIFANEPVGHDGTTQLVASVLVHRLRAATHTLAAAEWAVHNAVVAGRLRTGLVATETPSSNTPSFGRNGWTNEFRRGRRETVAVPKGEHTPFNCFSVSATELLSEWWHSLDADANPKNESAIREPTPVAVNTQEEPDSTSALAEAPSVIGDPYLRRERLLALVPKLEELAKEHVARFRPLHFDLNNAIYNAHSYPEEWSSAVMAAGRRLRDEGLDDCPCESAQLERLKRLSEERHRAAWVALKTLEAAVANDGSKLNELVGYVFNDPEALACLASECQDVYQRISAVAFFRWVAPFATRAKAIVDEVGEPVTVLSNAFILGRLSKNSRLAIDQWHHWLRGSGSEQFVPLSCTNLVFTDVTEINFDELRLRIASFHQPGTSRSPDGETVAKILADPELLAQLRQHDIETDKVAVAGFLHSCLTWMKRRAKQNVQP